MADEVPRNAGPFDVATIKSLVLLMRRHDLAEIDLRDGQQRIRLRRGVLKFSTHPGALPVASAMPSASAAPPPTAAAPQAPERKLIEIKSPTPGTFYARPDPESEPYVKVGSRVEPETVVCKIEAMKLYTDIHAECRGVIVEVVAENKQAVEFDEVLFRVDPAG